MEDQPKKPLELLLWALLFALLALLTGVLTMHSTKIDKLQQHHEEAPLRGD